MNIEDEGGVEILYNDCYGGWSPSKKACELYNIKMLKLDTSFVPVMPNNILYVDRHDPVLVQVYRELGREFDEKPVSKTVCGTILMKYVDFYRISEYDGKESVSIDKTQYDLCKLDEKNEKIRDILYNDGMSNDEKIIQIKEIYNTIPS